MKSSVAKASPLARETSPIPDSERTSQKSPATRSEDPAARIRSLEQKLTELEATHREALEDLRQLREAEALLRQSEERWRAIIETQPECVKVLAIDGALLQMNSAGLKMIEADSFEQVAHQCIYPIVAPEHRTMFQELMEQIFRGESGSLKFQIIGLKGTPRWLETRATPLRNERGEVVSLLAVTRDITERRRAELALRASEERYRILLELETKLSAAREPAEAAGIIFAAADQHWPIDAGALDIYLPDKGVVQGVVELDIVDGVRQQFTPAAAISKPSERFSRIMSQGAELILRQPPFTPPPDAIMFGDITRPSASILSVPIRWQGRSIGVLSVQSYTANAFTVEDLKTLQGLADHCGGTLERIRINTALRASEERFRALVELNLDGINIADRQGMLVYASPGNRAVLGHSAEDVHGRSAFESVHPDDLPIARAAWANLLANPEQVFTPVLRFRHQDGSWHWMDVKARNLLHVPAVNGIVVNWRDITERRVAEENLRRSQEQFERLFQSSPMAAGIFSEPHGRLVDVNARFLDLFQFTVDEVIGKTGQELGIWCDPSDRERLIENLRREREVRDFETRMRGKYGRECDLLLSAQVIELASGPTVMVQAQDVTERRQLEEQFRQVQKMEAIGQLAGGVAHDFNNILGAILGNVHLALADTDAAHPARESLEEIRRAGLRAKSLVQQILTFSRQQPQERRIVALGPLVLESARFLQATIPASVNVVTSIDANAPPVHADPTQIHQILVNLCTNAWHALDEQPGRIEISLLAATHDASSARAIPGLRPGRYSCLRVSDTGTGIDAPGLERIFDPFFTTKGPGKGTGLGLSVVHGIVQSHDGAIVVTSQPGEGSMFQVYLPAASTSPVETVVPPPASLQRGERQRILYLDDEEPLVLIATRMLSRLGYLVRGFTSPTEALKAFRENPSQFDLVITDQNMPGASGLTVAEEILKIRPEIPILLNSGRVVDDLKQQAHRIGIRDVLVKPTIPEDLCEAIHRFAIRRQTFAS